MCEQKCEQKKKPSLYFTQRTEKKMITSKKINTEKYAEKRNIPSLFYKMEDGKIIYKQQVENRTEKKEVKKKWNYLMF